jgi:hypothetical protein
MELVTCKYCGQELKFLGEHQDKIYYSCSFCEMNFELKDTSSDRKRKMSVPEVYDENFYTLTTRDFIQCDTITLYHYLKDIRAYWYSQKTILEGLKKMMNKGTSQYDSVNLNKPNKVDNNMLKELKNNYIQLTKKKFVVENIILERTGFLPEKITEDFLSEMIEQGRKASNRPMFVYIK